ncbi:aminoglycoside phosphotransferase [Psychromonas sp. CNPT3]|uniref:phosphotransferase n=1 Tax=Psychromonas sp. CNPT3 TaxID=314282 RepID=UPI00006E80A7|nr:phosphotransferase [Psychromonas sp. CNPT3]AGH80821.1 aminoglycoside phosphotransferase [Psychromonas sp. CNPT3]
MLLSPDERKWLSELCHLKIISVQKVAHAITNRVFVLHCIDNKKFIFKRLNVQARTATQRACEYQLQQLLSKLNLTPKVIAIKGSYKLQAFIAGETPKEVNTDSLTLLATQLSIIHQIPTKIAPLQCLASELKDLKKHSDRYVDEKEHAFYRQLATDLDHSSAKDTLCHGDLSLLNIVKTASGEVQILDWEYAVLACSAYDLASCCCINQLNEADENYLLDHYYDLYAEHLVIDKEKLKKEYVQYLSLFRYINKLWTDHFDKGSNSEI